MKRALVLGNEWRRRLPSIPASQTIVEETEDAGSNLRLFLLAFGAGFLFFSALIA